MSRICIKITGESGAGLLSTGEIVIMALKNLGFYVVADREYPSLIKGGHSCYMINASEKPIHSLSKKVDFMLAIDKQSLEAYYQDLEKGSCLVYGYERPLGVKEIIAELLVKKVKIVHQHVRQIAESNGGNVLVTNVVLVGMLWKVLGLPYSAVEEAVRTKFASKPKILEIDLKCVKAGFDSVEEGVKIRVPDSKKDTILIDGNRALALGAIHAGCRAYYAYPMSPSSSILTYMADMAKKYQILVKQGEDEITVANMTLGSMFMGTRALCATSGGGFDLMTETVSLAGMIENPFVVIVAQRPGPATGLPTWTAQADLNMAIHSAHGEFPKIVIAVSDATDGFDLIQHAFNFAEKFQCVVIVLTEKVIAETNKTVAGFVMDKIKIERGLVEGSELKNLENSDRFKVTDSGLSKRWLPGSSRAYYFANGDEHWEDGSLSEDSPRTAVMYDKRMRKMNLIEEAMPEPEVYGARKGADISFVGWGSSKNVMLDIIHMYAEKGVKVNYLHYSFVFPLKTKVLKNFFKENGNVNLIEGNYNGQLGDLVEAKLDVKFKKRLLKYDGRAFFVEDVVDFIKKNSKK
ncbi:MAG: 2-oxoacid:acceptor oxidoreductase subunit alpha [Patescibacteria group bacterium]